MDKPGSSSPARARMRSSFRAAARTAWNVALFAVLGYVLFCALWGVAIGVRASVTVGELATAGGAFLLARPMFLLLPVVAALLVPARWLYLGWRALSSGPPA